MRLMGGKPLISYAIENALSSEFVDDVVVSSDSEEILAYAAQFEGVTGLSRDTELALDAVTLDPVIYDAVVRREEQAGASFDIVVTLQPTSPGNARPGPRHVHRFRFGLVHQRGECAPSELEGRWRRGRGARLRTAP